MRQFNFCPNCGLAQLEVKNKNKQRCKHCKRVFYFNPHLAVGAIILNKNRILLAKRNLSPYKGYWDIPGGFLEINETPIQTLKRELKEELDLDNIKVKKLFNHFYPDFYGKGKEEPTLNFFYICATNEKEFKQSEEIAEVGWFDLNQLPPKIAFKNARLVLADFKKTLHSPSL